MSVEIGTAAESMSKSLSSLEVTPSVMHRITFRLTSKDQWYGIMREARALYGKDWRGQPRVKRRLERFRWEKRKVDIWFEVPEISFATWCAVKLAVEVVSVPNK